MSAPRNLSADERRAAAGSVCAYCGEESLDGRQPPEHPIPVAIGSAISIFTVCRDCNRRTGRDVDQPWLNHDFVRHERWRLGIRDGRHADQPLGHIFDGMHTDEEGHRVAVKDGVPRYVGSITQDGDRVQITAASQDRADELLARVKRRLAVDGKAVLSCTTERRSGVRPLLSKNITVSLSIGVRMGAKLGLAFGAEAYPEDWRVSPEAAQLREWLWSDGPVSASGRPLGWLPSLTHDREHPFSDPPNHTGSFWIRDDEQIYIVVLVFGTLGFTVPVAPLSAGLPPIAWESGPSHGGSVSTTREALLIKARGRYLARWTTAQLP